MNDLIALSTNGNCIADLILEIRSFDYDAETRLAEILGMDQLPEEITDLLLDNPKSSEVRYRLLCLGLSACTVLPPRELIIFVTRFCREFTLTEQERAIIKKCFRAAGLRKHPLPQSSDSCPPNH